MHALYFGTSSLFKTSIFYLLSYVSCLPSSNFFLPSSIFHPLSSKFKSSNFHILFSIFYFLPSIFLSAVSLTTSCLEGNLWPDTVDKRWQEEARMAGTTRQMNQIGSIQTFGKKKREIFFPFLSDMWSIRYGWRDCSPPLLFTFVCFNNR
jgi:hypothetical protein